MLFRKYKKFKDLLAFNSNTKKYYIIIYEYMYPKNVVRGNETLHLSSACLNADFLNTEELET